VSDPVLAAPALTRAVVRAGADVLNVGRSHHSLEDIYLTLLDGEDEVDRK